MMKDEKDLLIFVLLLILLCIFFAFTESQARKKRSQRLAEKGESLEILYFKRKNRTITPAVQKGEFGHIYVNGGFSLKDSRGCYFRFRLFKGEKAKVVLSGESGYIDYRGLFTPDLKSYNGGYERIN